MRSQPWWYLALAAALPVAAAAQQAPLSAPVYSIPVRLQLSAETLQQRFDHESAGGAKGPEQPGASVRIGAQASAAYAPLVARLFAAPGEQPAARLEVSVEQAGTDMDDDGWFAFVEHRVVLRARDGSEVARWQLPGEGRIKGMGAGAVPAAFERAAREAARKLDLGFEADERAARWLREQGAEVASSRPVPPGPPRPPPPRPAPERPSWLLFAEAGTGVVPTDNAFRDGAITRASSRGLGIPLLLKGGVAGRWVTAQLAWSSWTISYPPTAWNAKGSTASSSLGLEVGGVLRATRWLELSAGAGENLWWTRPASLASRRTTVPSLFAAARLVNVAVGPLQARVGFEVRKLFVPAQVYQLRPGNQFGIPPSYQRVEYPGLALGLLFGADLPIGELPAEAASASASRTETQP